MAVQTHLKAKVPVERRAEAQDYFHQLVPGKQPGWTERLGTGYATMEVTVAGDWVATVEASIEHLDTRGIEISVFSTPF